jgi:16S rRNA (cytidine1402-2'-O)-methyltransferase
MTATLYIVATPLGNLADLSSRAADCLRRVAVVAAEDTRRTRGLLAHLGARPQLLSFHAHSGPRRTEGLLDILRSGRDVALVTDAGTPGVSDPGPELVRRAREHGVTVVPIPGPSAVHAALAASGLPADRYVFLGFAPRKGSARAEWLARIRESPFTVVCF